MTPNDDDDDDDEDIVVSSSDNGPASEMSATKPQDQAAMQRPRPPQNRLASQSSFHGMDFDCYDVHDCYNYSFEKAKKEKAERVGSTTTTTNGANHGTLSPSSPSSFSSHKFPKSSSSNNIVGSEAASGSSVGSTSLTFRPRSTSSESIAAMRWQQQKKIRLGICAMDKKAQSQPMKEILSRLDVNGSYFLFVMNGIFYSMCDSFYLLLLLLLFQSFKSYTLVTLVY
jgi:hypothetical protein